MANYFSQFIPNIGINNPIHTTPHIPTIESRESGIRYLSIFNPQLIPDNAESNEELSKQLLIFISSSENDEGELSQSEKLNLIGLIRGIDCFGASFLPSPTSNGPRHTIIKSSKSSIIILELEPDYYIACSTTQVDQAKSHFISQQLIKLILEANRIFGFLNMSLDKIKQEYDIDVLKSILRQHWLGFMQHYNNQFYKIPKGLKWPNYLNYRGFLGLLKSDSIMPIAKKSSILMAPHLRNEVGQWLSNEQDELSPIGIVVSYFGKMNPKQYGLIHGQTRYNPQIGDVISYESLIDIYNWLEYHDYQNKLDSESLCSTIASDLFKTNLSIINPDVVEQDNQEPMVDLTLGLNMLNPINLTNNLIILPFNYTVTSVMSQFTGETESTPVDSGSNEQSWLSMPPFIRSYVANENTATESENGAQVGNTNDLQDEDVDEDNEDEEEEQLGEYLIGLQTGNILQRITRRLVYLPTRTKGEDDNIELIQQEYQLVVYTKDDIYITLIYKTSSTNQLENVEFYNELQHDILLPTIQEIQTQIISGSLINTSISSLKSIAGLLPPGDIDQEFFYVIFDPERSSFQTSLPYLPNILPVATGKSTPATRYQMAMYYLHDQLINLFLIQQDSFLMGNKLNEYFHKFTSNKLNDWMFYYIRHQNKFIIIIKNKNKAGSKRETNAKIVERSLLNKISDGIVDYTKLGFLDNLGDDVKYWLGQQVENGE